MQPGVKTFLLLRWEGLDLDCLALVRTKHRRTPSLLGSNHLPIVVVFMLDKKQSRIFSIPHGVCAMTTSSPRDLGISNLLAKALLSTRTARNASTGD